MASQRFTYIARIIDDTDKVAVYIVKRCRDITVTSDDIDIAVVIMAVVDIP
ncbi:MAG: spore coat protein [Clostridiales bacterium]|nr:spore coat protein [Clostridiales bacterium]